MKLQHSPIGVVEAGTDEAGRGCLAGPVTAAAVILPPNFKNDLLNDSKQLTEKQRNLLTTLDREGSRGLGRGACRAGGD
jgi:ribonuclease HII